MRFSAFLRPFGAWLLCAFLFLPSFLAAQEEEIELTRADILAALYDASANGDRELLDVLLSPHYNDFTDEELYGAAVMAINNRQDSALQMILKGGLDPDIYIGDGDKSDEAPLLYAAGKYQNAPAVKILLEAGANPAVMYNTSSYFSSGTFLHKYAFWGFLEGVELLLAYGADVNPRDKRGDTPLMDAAYEGRTDIVHVLLQAGAHVNAVNNYNGTALLSAARGYGIESLGTVRLLLEHGANTEIAADPWSITPLLAAMSTNSPNVGIVQLLLDYDAGTEHRDKSGDTPLLLAARYGHTEIARLLLEAEANVYAVDDEGRTVADMLLALRHKAIPGELWLLFMERAPNLFTGFDANGDTFFLRACRQNAYGIVHAMMVHFGPGKMAAQKDADSKRCVDIGNDKVYIAVMEALALMGTCNLKEFLRTPKTQEEGPSS